MTNPKKVEMGRRVRKESLMLRYNFTENEIKELSKLLAEKTSAIAESEDM